MTNMHDRMQARGYGNMPYGMGRGGMGYGGMGMMGGGMGYGGMGMMGGGMGYGGMGMMGGGMGYGGMYMLGLDQKQRDEIRKLFHEQRATRIKLMTDMMDIRDELADKFDAKELDAKGIGKIYSKLFDKQRQLIEQNIQLRNRMRSVLNKDQQNEFDQMRRGGMMGGGMGMMMR